MFVCDVGQGDAAYIQFPDGRDMLVDGGPNDAVLSCLSKHMPFWDRTIDIVLLSHPEKDHMQGLLSVLKRYHVRYFVHSDVSKGTEGDAQLLALVKTKGIPEKFLTTGANIRIGSAQLATVWPSEAQIASIKNNVLGAATSVNMECVVFWLRYKSFDVLFAGDADTETASRYIGSQLADKTVEVLKVPHHGSKTGMNTAFLDWLNPSLAVISVGKNMYGHPAPETLTLLADHRTKVLRTDQQGDIEIMSDGYHWNYK
jgi:competence protein ComEC